MSVRIHPTAIVEGGVEIGEGTSVWDNVHIRGPSRIGRDCIVGGKSYIAYGVTIGDRVKINSDVYIPTGVTIETGVMISAGTILTNDRFPRATTPDLQSLRGSDPDEHTLLTVVRAGATIGAGCRIGSGLEIGEFAMVGMGAVVTASVSPFTLVFGVPARAMGLVCRCGEPVYRGNPGEAPDSGVECPGCGCSYRIRSGALVEIPDRTAMTDRRKETWGIAGGGILGQVLALRLVEAGKRVTLLEAAPETGGLAAAWTIDGITWDKFYHVILPSDARTLGLIGEIGLRDAVHWARSRTGFFADGRMSSLDSAFDYLRLPALGPIGKARLAFTLMMAGRISDGRPLEQVPVRDWLTRWSGRDAFDRVWQPLLRAKLGNNADIASAAFIWATARRLYLARSAGSKSEVLGFVDGGYDRILTALRERLRAAGVEVRTGCPVSRVVRHGEGLRVDTSECNLDFDRVVSTLPANATARLCPDLNPVIRARLDGVVYQGVLCASVVLDRPLGGYYLTYLTDPNLPFTAIVEMSALAGTARFRGRTLVYLPRYATQQDEVWGLKDDAIRDRFTAGLLRVYPDLDLASISAFRVARVKNVMAVPTLGYTDVAPAVMTNVEGFHIVNSAQITDGTLNVDATLGVLDRALPQLLEADPRKNLKSAA